MTYYAPFISTAHELIHIAYSHNNTYYKHIPLDKLPLVKFAHSSLEELYTIQLDKNFNEAAISSELGYSKRITHGGYGALLTGYTESKTVEIAVTLKGALVRAGMMLDKLTLDMPEIKSYYDVITEKSEDFANKTNEAYKLYRKIFNSSIVKKVELENPNIGNNPNIFFNKSSQENEKEVVKNNAAEVEFITNENKN